MKDSSVDNSFLMTAQSSMLSDTVIGITGLECLECLLCLLQVSWSMNQGKRCFN